MTTWTVDRKEFTTIIKAVSKAADTAPYNAYLNLNSVRLEFKGNTVTAMATDRYILGYSTLPVISPGKNVTVTLPLKELTEALTSKSTDPMAIDISLENGDVTESGHHITALTDTYYQNLLNRWRELRTKVDQAVTYNITVDRVALQDAIKELAKSNVGKKQVDKKIIVELTNDKIELHSDSHSMIVKSNVANGYISHPSVHVSQRLLQRSLAAAKGSTVSLGFGPYLKPITVDIWLNKAEQIGTRYFVMPMLDPANDPLNALVGAA